MRSCKVLFVDDDHISNFIVSLYFNEDTTENAHYHKLVMAVRSTIPKDIKLEVQIAADAISALELDVFSFDIIISDINMPEMDGIEFAGQLQQMGYKNRFYFLTSTVGSEWPNVGNPDFLKGVISKPF